MTARPIAWWVGSALGLLASLQMLFSALMKWWPPEDVAEHYVRLGWSQAMMGALALVELACTVLYLTPRFAVLGAILLTGYLGGAVATHVRIGDGQMSYPLALGVMLWVGVWLREPRLRPLFPLSPASQRT